MNDDAHVNSIGPLFAEAGRNPHITAEWRSPRGAEGHQPSTQAERIMHWNHDVAYFFGGVFLTNAVPHLVSGLMGRPFQSPFAKPPGQGLSSSTTNVLWAFFNIIAGYFLILHVGEFDPRAADHASALGLGILFSSLILARTFGKLHGGNIPKR